LNGTNSKCIEIQLILNYQKVEHGLETEKT